MTRGGFCNWVNTTLLPKNLEKDQNKSLNALHADGSIG